jgi:hypothetical protein
MAGAEQFNLKRFQLLMLLSGGGVNDEEAETENTGETPSEATTPRITTPTTTKTPTQADTSTTGRSPSDETSEPPTKTGLNPSLSVEMGRTKSRPLSYIPSSTEVALALKPASSSSSSSTLPKSPATPWETSSKPRTPRDGSLRSVIGTRVIPPEYRTKGKAPPTIRVLTEEDSSFVMVDLRAETTVGEVKVKVAKKFGGPSASDELIGLGLGCDAKHFELFIIENERGNQPFWRR